MIRWTLRVILILILLTVLGTAALFGVLYKNVSEEAKTHIERGIIDAVIFSESPVYYDDGKSVIGVFFEKTHRKYIHFKEIPPVFIKALIAAEDRNFYSHYGFDVMAIVRAGIANMKSGRISQGGSTITQQTAKNIFNREKRSYAAKLKELIQALVLERQYSKDEILEMYVNQFFVTGFGRGLSVASRYFFDKDAERLDLTESAFIAGSLKSPNRFNPFIKKSANDRNQARRLAKQRKDYVLGNMLEMSYITQAEYEEALKKEIPFKEGRVTYRLNVILDYVRDQLDSEYFKGVLQEQGVDNIATSGIKVYTSVNKEIQEGSLQSLRRHLPLLDVKLTGMAGDLFLDKYRDLVGDPMKKPEEDIAFYGRITGLRVDKDNPMMTVSWDGGGEGVIDYEGMWPLGDAWLKGRTWVWAEFGKRNVLDFLKLFQVGQIVAIRHAGTVSGEGKPRLFLSKIPSLDGGVIVIRKGMVKAMVGGFFDRFFNRAADAKRQLGSIFKTLVYAAALELKWNTLDPLPNKRDVYPFEATFYIPRPDHAPEADKVSMLWAGAKSENLATVWLLYHLTDHLSMGEFRQVADSLGLGRTARETYEEYGARIRDKHGVMVSDEDVREAAFEEAKKEIETDLIFSGEEEALWNLHQIHYKVDPGNLSVDGEMDPALYRLSFQRLVALNQSMKQEMQNVKEILSRTAHGTDLGRLLGGELSRLYVTAGAQGNQGPVVYSEARPAARGAGLEPLSFAWDGERVARLNPEEVWIDGLLPSRVIDTLHSMSVRNLEKLRAHRKYDPELLFRVGDFKRVVNLAYVTRLSERMGIATKLDPVLSFPLGANSISILEAALSYQSMMTGKIYPLEGIASPAMLPIITRIEDRQGNLLWEYKPRPKRVLSDRVSGMLTDILRMVMHRGTGRTAKDAIQLNLEIENQRVSIPVPTFGKTGTANKFTNSSFVGFIPGPEEKTGQLTIDDGYVIASYVGYDDNRPMKGRAIVIYGSSGALPLYVDTGNAVVNSREYTHNLHMADVAFDLQTIPRRAFSDLQPVVVSPTSGLPVGSRAQDRPSAYPTVYSDVEVSGGQIMLKRVFEPARGGQHADSR